jgi:hypothetical protein
MKILEKKVSLRLSTTFLIEDEDGRVYSKIYVDSLDGNESIEVLRSSGGYDVGYDDSDDIRLHEEIMELIDSEESAEDRAMDIISDEVMLAAKDVLKNAGLYVETFWSVKDMSEELGKNLDETTEILEEALNCDEVTETVRFAINTIVNN